MAEQRCGDQRAPPGAAAQLQDAGHKAMNSAADTEAEELPLEEILRLYNQPINEEQAWAVCYQCCRTLAKDHRSWRRSSAAAGASSPAAPRKITGPGDVRIQKDGSVRVEYQGCEGKCEAKASFAFQKYNGMSGLSPLHTLRMWRLFPCLFHS